MASDTNDSDRALIERAPRDPAAFGTLFERHFDAVFGYIVRRTRDWDAARDLTSEVFLKALRNAWRYKWKGVPVFCGPRGMVGRARIFTEVYLLWVGCGRP